MMTFKQFYAILMVICGIAVMLSDSTLGSGLILVVLSFIYWELVKDGI